MFGDARHGGKWSGKGGEADMLRVVRSSGLVEQVVKRGWPARRVRCVGNDDL